MSGTREQTERVRVGSTYTDGAERWEITAVNLDGCYVSLASDWRQESASVTRQTQIGGLGIAEFRRRFWLVKDASREGVAA